MEKISIETIVRVYNDTTGEYLEVCPDADGLGMLEIRSVSKDGDRIYDRLTLTREQAKVLPEAITKVLQQNSVLPT